MKFLSQVEFSYYYKYLKTQRFSFFGTCFDVSNIIISHHEYIEKIYKMIGIYNYSY